MERHRSGFDEFAALPVAAFGGDFANVDFRVEIGGKGAAVVATVHVDDVERMDFIEMVLQCPCCENIGDAGVEAGAEQGGEARLLETLLIGPLPAVFKFGHIFGLVVGGVEVVNTRSQTGFHQRQILIREGDVDE